MLQMSHWICYKVFVIDTTCHCWCCKATDATANDNHLVLQTRATRLCCNGGLQLCCKGVVSYAARASLTLDHCCKWVAIDASRSVARGTLDECEGR